MRRLSNEDEEEDGLYLPRVAFEVDKPPRRSFQQRSASFTSALSFMRSRRSFSYDKLCQIPVQLTIVKLDGSSFGIEVAVTATIAELKQAVERVFSHMPTKGPGKISWRHVWGHFCLSYDGQKLVKDDEFVKVYGIKDGDQLYFVRHVSTAYNLIKKCSRKRLHGQQLPPGIEDDPEETDQQIDDNNDCNDLENSRFQLYAYEGEDPNSPNASFFGQLLRGWLFYSRLSTAENMRFETEPYPSRSTDGFFGCFRSMFQFYSNKPPSYSSRV